MSGKCCKPGDQIMGYHCVSSSGSYSYPAAENCPGYVKPAPVIESKRNDDRAPARAPTPKSIEIARLSAIAAEKAAKAGSVPGRR